MLDGLALDGMAVTLALLLVLGVLFIFTGPQVVPDGKARIVERLGRRHRVLLPGFNVIVPILDKIKRTGFDLYTILEDEEKRVSLVDEKGNISLAEQRLDPAEMTLIAKDNTEVIVDSVAYFKIVEPMRSAYDVASFADSFLSIILTTLRQEVGKQDGDTIITSRDVLSENLRSVLQEATSNWGIQIMRVELEEIRFDEEVSQKLSEARKEELMRRAQLVATQAEADQLVVKSDAEKRAVVLKAEGERESQIQIAEGKKQAQILEAQGEFEEQKLIAEAKFLNESREQEGKAKGFAAVSLALAENPNAIVALEALKAQEVVAGAIGSSTNALIIPAETAGLFGALASVVKGLGSMTNTENKE